MKIATAIASIVKRLVFRGLVSAANDDTLSIANALGGGEVFAIVQGDSLFIPFGKYQHPLGLQLFDKASAEILQAACNDLGEFPIYKGHPDVPGRPDSNPAAPAIGWCGNITIENDGARFAAKWNEIGQLSIANCEFKFYSPHWDLRRVAGGIQPVRMKSIGLTNNPRIPVPAIANDDTAPFVAPQWLIDMLVAAKLLDPEKATDEVNVKAAIDAAAGLLSKVRWAEDLAAEAAQMKLDLASRDTALQTVTAECDSFKKLATEAQTQLTAANDTIGSLRKARVTAEVARLVDAGKLKAGASDAVSEELISLANDETLTTRLAELHAAGPVLKTSSATGDLSGGKSKVLESAANDTAARSAKREALISEELTAVNDKLAPSKRYDIAFNRARAKSPDLF